MTSPPDEGFVLGPEAVYPVPEGAGVVVADSISGGNLVFADGGGTIRVARIESGPSPSAPGAGFWMEYDGTSRVQLELPDEDDQVEVLYGYGRDLGSIDDELGRVERWTCVPVAESLLVSGERRVRYELVFPFDWTPPRGMANAASNSATGATTRFAMRSVTRSAEAAGRAPTHVGFQAYHLGKLSPTSTQVERHNAAVRQAWSFLQTVIDSLPTRLGAYVATQVASGGAYEPTFYNSEDHKYKGFVYISDLFPIRRPMVFLSSTSTEHTVAHEVGHWVDHILTGDTKYLVLEAQAPSSHIPGTVHADRSSVMEDYAHFCDYFCTGSVQNASPEEPWQFFDVFPTTHGVGPVAQDWPSTEGFATVLLASLIRQSQSLHAFGGGTEDVPVIGASFREVWPLLAGGASSIGALRDSVEAFLDARGKRPQMIPLAERIGWRYHARGTLVGDDGEPIRGARVRSVYFDGTKTWRSPGSTTTDSDGRFALSRIFPGDSRLRVYQGSDSTDVQVSIPWSHPTDVERDLGELTVGAALLAQLHRTLWIDLDFEGDVLYSDGFTRSAVTLTTFTSYDGGESPIWDGGRFELSFTKPIQGGSYSLAASGEVSSSGRELLELTVTEDWREPYSTYYKKFSVNHIPINGDDIQPEDLYFLLDGPEVQSHLSVLRDDSTPTGGNTVTITSIDWQSEETVPAVTVRFRTGR
ncbi:MAG: carboxypeptidase-like regulatory domain-containing protein [Candidatus Eisenbacteria bacterium]